MVEALDPPQVRIALARRGADLVRLYASPGKQVTGRRDRAALKRFG
jgi:hypothetical protein